jgi:hypothetical protein
MTIDPATGQISWQTAEVDGPFVHTVTVQVRDSHNPAGEAQFSFTITVAEDNTPPVLEAIGPRSVDEETPLSFTISASDSDLPAQTLTYTAAGLPTGASFNPATRAFTWTPTEAQGGADYKVTFRVSDPYGLYDEEEVTITVNKWNKPPVIGTVASPQVIDELALYQFTVPASDNDLPAQTVTYFLDENPDGMTINDATGQISWTPTEAQGPGSYDVTVRVVDDLGLEASKIFQLTVREVNQNPVITKIGVDDALPGLNYNLVEGALFTTTVAAHDNDLPAQTLTYALVTKPSAMTINAATGAISWQTAEADGPVVHNVTVRVRDNHTPPGEAQFTFTISVAEDNRAPVLNAIGSKTIDEETLLSFTISGSDPDLPPQVLAYTATGLPSGATFNTSTRVFNWMPTEAQGGADYTVTFRVTDSYDAFAEETITITVNKANKPPVIDPILPNHKTVDEGSLLSFTVTGSDSDLPAQALVFSLVSPPAGASITPGGLFTWTPSYDQSGSYTITVRLTDDGAPVKWAEQTFTVTVNESNFAPVIDPITNLVVNEGDSVLFNVTASDPDDGPGSLQYSLSFGAHPAARLTRINNNTAVFSWVAPEADGTRVYTFTIVVNDGQSMDSATFTITVNDVNQPPVLAAISDRNVVEGETISFTAQASDIDLPAQTLAFRLGAGAPPAANINPASGAFTWATTTADGPGVYNLTVYVTDGEVEVSRSFTVTVQAALDLRLSGTAAPNPVLAGGSLTYTLTLTNVDSDGDAATGVLLSGTLADGLTLAAGTSPACALAGQDLQCSLPGSLAAGQSVTLTVAVDVPFGTPGGTLLAFSPSAGSDQFDSAPSNNSASLLVAVTAEQTVYTGNFDTGPGSGWTDTGGGEVTTSTTPSGRNFLGEFNNQEIMLELNELPQHNYVEVSFDLYILRSWDGNRASRDSAMLGPQFPPIFGPDIWEFAVGEETLLSASFANWDQHTQSYPKNFGQGSFPARTGSVEAGSLGYTYEHYTNQDAVYRLSFTTAHTGETLRLYFRDLGLQPIEDESWGLANLRVKVNTTPSAAPTGYRFNLPVMMR